MAGIITLTGPSGAGKSTAIDFLLKNNKQYFDPICIPKFTTRSPRKDDSDREVIYCDKLPDSCTLIYQQYNVRYGLSSDRILDNLKDNKVVIVVLNDVRTISEVKRIFGSLVVSCFVYRQEPSIENFTELAIKRGVTDKTIIETRFRKAQAIYRIYIENIQLFDSVLINSGNKIDLKRQVNQVISRFKPYASQQLKS